MGANKIKKKIICVNQCHQWINSFLLFIINFIYWKLIVVN